jgi:Na+/citrate or Na+/malate symporter
LARLNAMGSSDMTDIEDTKSRPATQALKGLIGAIPWPVYLALIAFIYGLLVKGKKEDLGDISVMIAILSVGGYACAELGKRLPLIRSLGAAAIFATFIPSYLVFTKLLPAPLIGAVKDFTKASQFLYLYIAAIVVGSILSMDRKMLVQGFLKIFVPVVSGSVLAAGVGMLVGLAFGLNPSHTFFFIVIPVMAGGVGEGAIPLSVGYAALLHQADSGVLLADILPSVMFASLTAIVMSGLLNFYARNRPTVTGYGVLQMGEHDDPALMTSKPSAALSPADIAAAGATVIALYMAGLLLQRVSGFPAPITMLVLAVIANIGRLVSNELKSGAFAYYKFFSTAVTYPLLFAIGVAMTPWDKLIAAFTIGRLVTIVAMVVTLFASGYFVGRKIGMYPVEAAIVTGCRASQGGTGDVAILTACDRLQLMPFAQIATRIGGALTVTLALALMRIYG